MKNYMLGFKQSLLLLGIYFVTLLSVYAQTPWKEKAKLLPELPYMANNEDDFGSAISSNNDFIVIGSSKYQNKGCAYVISNNRLYDTLAILTASNGSYGDRFGHSVSISDSTIVVGARGVNQEEGAAYIFVKPATGWSNATEDAILRSSDGAQGANFGVSVSIYNNVVVVGAEYSNASGTRSGSAYVFTKPISGWQNMTEAAKLSSSGLNSYDCFGCAVSIFKDVIAVGAYGDDEKADLAGCVYVFEKPLTGWGDMTETAKLMVSDGAAYSGMGTSVSIYDSIIVAGATGVDYIGEAYVFKSPESGWSSTEEIAKLSPSDGSHSNQFGNSIAIYDSIVVVGSHYSGNSIPQEGKAYVFIKPSSGWEDISERAILTGSELTSYSNLGHSVSITGNTIIVGAPEDNANGYRSGAAFVYEKPVTGWFSMTETVKILPVAYLTNQSDAFGASVAVSDSLIVVGSPRHKTNTGIVYVFSAQYPFDTLATLTASDAAEDQSFGHHVIIEDNIIVALGNKTAYLYEKPDNGWSNMTETAILTCSGSNYSFGSSLCIFDSTILVGGGQFDGTPGIVYVFVRPESGWTNMTETAQLTASDGISGDQFGCAVSGSNNVIAIGAQGVDVSGSNNGAVYVFVKPASGWVTSNETAKLTASDGGDHDRLGVSVSIYEDIIVSGSYRHNSTRGAIYLYAKPETGWQNSTENQKLTASDANVGDYLGYSVRIYENTIAAGAYGTDQSGMNSGSIYLFRKKATGWEDMTETYKLTGSEATNRNYYGWNLELYKSKLVVGAQGDFENGRYSGIVYYYQDCNSYSTIYPKECSKNYISPSGKYSWSISGTYYDTIPNSNGCDSIITIELTILKSSTSSLTETTCGSYISPSEKYTWTTSGTYYDTISNSVGCDSIITIDLIIDCSNSILSTNTLKSLVYPNPAKDKLLIDLEELNSRILVEIFTMNGQLILTDEYFNLRHITIDLDIPNDTYLIRVTNGEGNSNSFKILKY